MDREAGPNRVHSFDQEARCCVSMGMLGMSLRYKEMSYGDRGQPLSSLHGST